MLSQCLWCKKGAATDVDILICFGCEKSFHGSCCSLTRASVKVIKDVPAVKWFCLNCDESSFANIITNRFNGIDNKIDKMVNGNQYEELLKRMDGLTNEVSAIKLVVDSQIISEDTSGEIFDDVFRRKRLRSGRTKQKSTTSVPAWPLIMSGNGSSQCITGTDASSSLKVIEPKAWFHVSRFGPDTTVDDLKTYVSEKISSNEVECYLLVPKGRDPSELRFVSFKIGVLGSSKSALMDASIWPSNVSVRHFEQRSGFPTPKYATIPTRMHQD